MLTIPNGGVSNAMVQNATFIVSAGAGLTGGGAGSLGGSAPALAASINHDTSLVGNGGPRTLGRNTSFTNNLYARPATANIFRTGTPAIQTGPRGTEGVGG